MAAANLPYQLHSCNYGLVYLPLPHAVSRLEVYIPPNTHTLAYFLDIPFPRQEDAFFGPIINLPCT